MQHTALPFNHDRKMTPVFRQGAISGALLTNQRLLICLLHNHLIAKLAANGFEYDSLVFIQNYLSERQQRPKVDNAYSTYSGILFGVP